MKDKIQPNFGYLKFKNPETGVVEKKHIIKSSKKEGGFSILQQAVLAGEREVVAEALRLGDSPWYKNGGRCSALNYVLACEKREILNLFKSHYSKGLGRPTAISEDDIFFVKHFSIYDSYVKELEECLNLFYIGTPKNLFED